MKICIIGGGGLGHTCAGVLSNKKDVTVDLLTNHPEKWCHEFNVNTPDKGTIIGRLERISSKPEDLIPDADVVFLCLPAFLVKDTILRIKPYLNSSTIVGSVFGSTGFFIFAHNNLPMTTKLFAFQRVPYVSRVVNYGREANLLGYRDKLIMAVENVCDKEDFRISIEALFGEPVDLCDSFYEVTLSNSNPILHTGRLYTMWKDWDGMPYEYCSLFYKEWTIETSQIEMEMDKEFFDLLKKLNVSTKHIETLLQHYDSLDAEGMTKKIRSIESLSSILSPMKEVEGGWVPDFNSRYFIEDFLYGLKYIVSLAKENNVACPNLNMVFEWGMSKCK